MSDSRYSRLDNQAPAQSQLKANSPEVGRSAHDFSRVCSGTALIGALMPFDCFEVVPNEDIDINLIPFFEFRNPTVRPLLNGFRIFFHYYYNRLVDLWEGAKNWLDNGRSGKLNLMRPNLIYKATYTDFGSTSTRTANACTPLSLLACLDVPVEAVQDGDTVSPLRWFQTAYKTSDGAFDFTTVNQSYGYFPADCAFAYQKNWRDYYANKNLLQNNKYWFPDNEEHFILSYSCTNACGLLYEDEDFTKLASTGGPQGDTEWKYFLQIVNLVGDNTLPAYGSTPEPNNPSTSAQFNPQPSIYVSRIPNLSGLKFRQFRGDRFTTGVPFPDLIRGDIPALAQTGSQLETLWNDDSGASHGLLVRKSSDSSDLGMVNYGIYSASAGIGNVVYTENPLSSVTMSDIYTLETITAFKRKMGMTNGDYNQMIKAQYGVDPNTYDRKGTYLGGFYVDFNISSVTQQSQSDNTPLGTKAGQGIASGQGNIGHFHTPDFGWIQGYFSIVPDIFYVQGYPRQYMKKSNMEMYYPLFNNLPAQAIKNSELFVSGNATQDELPFAYEDRYAEFKSRPNVVRGLMALGSRAVYDSSRIMARRFTTLPALNSQFVTMIPENIDMNPFTVQDEPPFDYQIGISCRRVFPGPYTAIEGSLSSPRLNA